jgi:diacylglycerol kinase family enzyme
VREKICFIINPVSGTRRKDAIPELIRRYVDSNRFLTEIVFTERCGHACELARQQTVAGTPYIVAVGGDGTVNEIASALRDSRSAMGIVPCGSGNGLARHLHLPLTPAHALNVINHSRVQPVDYGLANGIPFFCTLGTGFDARVSDLFARAGKRGVRKYISIIAREFIRYRAQNYRLTVDGRTVDVKAMLVTVANASQYGNNGYISPLADIADGKLDVCVLRPFPKILAPELALRLVGKTIHKSLYYQSFQGASITIDRESAASVHLDGEPFKMGETLDIHIVHHGLKVLVAKQP